MGFWAIGFGSTLAGYKQVKNWVNMMIQYCQLECGQGNNHMFTISAPSTDSNYPNSPYGPASYDPNDFVNLMNIDFYINHFYDTSPFTDFRINYLANRAKYLYPGKPFLIGEYGLTSGNDKGNNYCGTFDPSAGPAGEYVDDTGSQTNWMYINHFLDPYTGLYDASEYHNGIFASFLSGCAGAVVSWTEYSCPGCGQFAYILPLLYFMQGEDLNMENCIAITNPSPLNTAYSLPAPPGAIPISFLANELPDSIFHMSINAWGFNSEGQIDNTHLGVFALQYTAGINKNKIIGWVRNLNNWWYNLPHAWDNTSPVVGGSYPCLNLDPIVEPISKATITITNVLSNTLYKIDFYSVYPEWPATVGGPPVNGGIIRSINITSVGTTLTFTIPGALAVLSLNNGPCAPDYGFKITPQ